MIIIENQYDIGEIVYLRTDEDQYPRVIVSIEVYKNGEILYKICRGTESSYHYEFEMSSEKTYNNVG